MSATNLNVKTVNVHNLKIDYERGHKVASFSSLANGGPITTMRVDDIRDGLVRVYMPRSKLKDPRLFQYANQVVWLNGNWQ